MTPARMAELEALCAAATPGPWTQGHNPPEREPIEYMAAAYHEGPPGTVHLVYVPWGDADINEAALFTAITGNGPTSEANAAFVAAARTALPAALAEVRRLREIVHAHVCGMTPMTCRCGS